MKTRNAIKRILGGEPVTAVVAGLLEDWDAILDGGFVNEATIARAIKHMRSRPFFMISAYRGDKTAKQNRARSKELGKTLAARKMGPIRLVGYFQEEGMTKPEKEMSYLVPMHKSISEKTFRRMALALCKKYNQDSILYGDGQGYHLLDKAGLRVMSFKKITVGKVSQVYSHLRHKSKTPFVFEGVLTPNSVFDKRFIYLQGYRW